MNMSATYWKPKYKWELQAWLCQNGIDVPLSTPKAQLYAIFYKIMESKKGAINHG